MTSRFTLTLPRYLALIVSLLLMMTAIGWGGIDRYNRERADALIAREVSKLTAVEAGAAARAVAASRAHRRLHQSLTEQAERIGQFGGGRIDSIFRIAAQRAMETVFDTAPQFKRVEVFDAEGRFLLGAENLREPDEAPETLLLKLPVGQHVTAMPIEQRPNFQVMPPELERRAGQLPEFPRPVLYGSSWVFSPRGDPTLQIVMTYDLSEFHEWASQIAGSPEGIEYVRVYSNGKILIGGDRFEGLEFAVDRGVADSSLADVLPDVWAALIDSGLQRLERPEGVYLFQRDQDEQWLRVARGGTGSYSLLFIAREVLDAGGFFNSVAGSLVVGGIYGGSLLLAWIFWTQLSARREVEAQRALVAQSLDRLEHATQFARIGLLEIDIGDDRVYANDTFFAMHGVPRPEEGPLSVTQLNAAFPGYGDVQQRFAEAARHLLQGSEGETFDYDYERPTGEQCRLRVRLALDTAGPDEQLVRSTYTDITDLYQKKQALRRAAAQQNTLFTIIAHELRTPAAAIQMMATEVLQEPVAVPVKRDLLATANHLLSVIDDLRTVVDPEADLETHPEVFTLGALMQEAERQITTLFTRQGMALEVSLPVEEDLPLLADAYRLRAVLTNLLRNAAYHSGGTQTWVTATLLEGDPDLPLQLRIEVDDNGRGIPRHAVERVFDPFERGDTQAGGSGIGLHLARSWLEIMGGSLRYRDSLFGGASFEMVVPVARARAAEAPGAGPAIGDETWLSQWLEGGRVLLVEDDALLSAATERLLKRHFDVSVDIAADGAEGLAAARHSDYTLILSDYLMPSLDGVAMIEALRGAGNTTPIVVLTATAMGAERDTLLRAGATLVLMKPINLPQLAAGLRPLVTSVEPPES